jgi:hypothetical protein
LAERVSRRRRTEPANRKKDVQPPSTDRLAKHFDATQDEILEVLNRLENDGLLRKERRQSAGMYGNGYDGALFSTVLLTKVGLALVRRNTKLATSVE